MPSHCNLKAAPQKLTQRIPRYGVGMDAGPGIVYLEYPEHFICQIPYFNEQIDFGEIIFTEPFHMEEYRQNDLETVLHYFLNDFVPGLGFSSSLRVSSHTECIRYIREYIIAHRLKLDEIQISLADRTLNYEENSPLTPSPRLIEVLSDAGSQSSTLYHSLNPKLHRPYSLTAQYVNLQIGVALPVPG